jgi:hypothetical protein
LIHAVLAALQKDRFHYHAAISPRIGEPMAMAHARLLAATPKAWSAAAVELASS